MSTCPGALRRENGSRLHSSTVVATAYVANCLTSDKVATTWVESVHPFGPVPYQTANPPHSHCCNHVRSLSRHWISLAPPVLSTQFGPKVTILWFGLGVPMCSGDREVG